MSKTIGKILAVATIVASIALIPATGGGSLLLGSSVTIGAATSALIMAGLAVASFANALLMPKARQGARQAAVVTLSIGEVGREAIIGEGLSGGSLVDAFNWGGENGTDWECQIICLADHRCEGLTGFYVNDKYVAFAGDGQVAGYNGQLEVYFRDGRAGQTVPPVVLTNGAGWTSNDVGAGLTWVAVCYKADSPKAKNPIWTAGRPSFAWLVKGMRCYQARKDSSVGGSGAHRRDDPATWEWTDNPIDCRYNWARGIYALDQVDEPGMLLIGRGLSEQEAPPENVFARANLCDEAVAIDAGGTEKRYRANGVIAADETFLTVEEWFASACAGVIVQPEGSVEIDPGQAKSPVFFFSDDDLIVGSKVSFSHFLSESSDEWINTVVPRYVEPSQKYAEHGAPVRRVMSTLVEDGGPREQTLSLPLVTSGTQAGRCGEIARRLGRLPKRAQVTLGPDFVEVEEGDWGVWTSNRYLGGESVMFRVDAYSCGENWQMTLNLRQIEAAVYARDSDVGSSAVAIGQEEPPEVAPPSADDWTLSTVAIDGLPALRITGGVENDYLDRIAFEYCKANGATPPEDLSGWIDAGSAGPDATEWIITGIEGETDYVVAMRYVVGGRISDPLYLGTATTPPNPWNDYVESANDRNPLIPDTPGGMSTPQVVRTLDSGNVTVRCTFTFTASPDPANKNSVDFFELGVFASDDDDFHTMGTSNDEVWTIVTGDLPSSSHPTIFLDDKAPNKYYTFGVRAVRKVHSDISATGWVKSAIRQLSTPFRPAAAHNYTGNIGGVSANEIAEAAENFNQGNDRNGLTPPAATSVGLSSVTYPDSTAALTVTWAYMHSTNPAATNNIDGFLVGLRLRTSSAGYSYTSSDDGLIRWESVEANLRTVTVEGKPANYYYTAIVIPYRRVDLDVAATGIIKATAAQSSPSTPHQPAPAPNFTGKLDGETATNVKTWSGYANAGLNSDGTVKNAKVLTGSILDGAINEADWVSQGATITLGTNDGVQTTYLTADHAGERLIVQFILDYQITMSNPDPDDEATFTVQTYVQRIAGGAITLSDQMTLGEVWTGAVAVGSKKFGRRVVALEYAFDGLTSGAYNAGYRITTNATCGVTCRAYRYLRADDKRADQ